MKKAQGVEMKEGDGKSVRDHLYMAAAARLARRHLGQTGQNPSVGALIVREEGENGRIVGRGVTALGGRPHAEPQALEEAGALARGATAYVTLEPCSHIGKTPPCVDALIGAGIARVVIGLIDPDPRVAGRGVARLEGAGIAVETGIGGDLLLAGLSAYLHGKIHKRPEVTLKLACSKDGMIGYQQQGNIAISGEISRTQSHMMRAEHDAILVGVGTALLDNPRLDCRLNGLNARSPIRIVLDSNLSLPLDSQLIGSAAKIPLWVIGVKGVDEARAQQLSDKGARVVVLGESDLEKSGFRESELKKSELKKSEFGISDIEKHEKHIDLSDLMQFLSQQGINSLLVEGGSKIAHSFWHLRLVDRLALFQSPVVMGDQGYPAPVFKGLHAHYSLVETMQWGQDIYQEWRKKNPCLQALSQTLAPLKP